MSSATSILVAHAHGHNLNPARHVFQNWCPLCHTWLERVDADTSWRAQAQLQGHPAYKDPEPQEAVEPLTVSEKEISLDDPDPDGKYAYLLEEEKAERHEDLIRRVRPEEFI